MLILCLFLFVIITILWILYLSNEFTLQKLVNKNNESLGFVVGNKISIYGFAQRIETKYCQKIGFVNDWVIFTKDISGSKVSFQECRNLKFVWIMSDFLLKPLTSVEFSLHLDLYEVDISNSLIEYLDFSICVNLKKLNFTQKHNHKLSIKLNKKNVIELFNLRNVNLGDLKFIKALNVESLKFLSLSECSFPSTDLEFLKYFTNLETLYLYNCISVYGSLIYLKEMRKLDFLSIGSSKLDSGFKHLSDSVQTFHCKSTKIYEELQKYNSNQSPDEKLLEGWRLNGIMRL
ncbi:23668_t:CDS:1 [Gigaspora margarita]|uniref:23668_t:CDS:1 n=1 Tax=Gigaspora margarita TaxID=4874 RepID=A0ABN7V9R0_GIGMA|nr:23668_t:CDS:1 [Gigaspora margarita]